MEEEKNEIGSGAASEKIPSSGLVFDFQESGVENCILECKGLSKNYGGFIALSNVNLRIPAGGIVGLLGPNGSGKTTLIKLAMGMLQPTSGEILIDGQKTGAATKAITAYLPMRIICASGCVWNSRSIITPISSLISEEIRQRRC